MFGFNFHSHEERFSRNSPERSIRHVNGKNYPFLPLHIIHVKFKHTLRCKISTRQLNMS